MKEIVYIFIGGGVGSVLRHLAQISINERMSGIGFPFSWGTFIVNIAGSFLIGLFYSVSERWNLSMEMRLFLTTGLCGGFTTFSTFSNDGLSLLRGEFYSTFLLYALLSIGLGLVAVLAGGAAGKLLG
ncbi:fluoride efflux transporter CrcB [Bacteroides sp.]|uniref:fluoride efflux transporter CrcB n=1 Tax=Bacteroides sp. TaxID=29523 RepID=UPI0025BFC2A7|nr:fluoride efflux transporter CrcB [Bacteroides sp.]